MLDRSARGMALETVHDARVGQSARPASSAHLRLLHRHRPHHLGPVRSLNGQRPDQHANHLRR